MSRPMTVAESNAVHEEIAREDEIDNQFREVAGSLMHALRCECKLPFTLNALVDFPLSGLEATIRVEVRDARKSNGPAEGRREEGPDHPAL